jgi:hypothetical protein
MPVLQRRHVSIEVGDAPILEPIFNRPRHLYSTETDPPTVPPQEFSRMVREAEAIDLQKDCFGYNAELDPMVLPPAMVYLCDYTIAHVLRCVEQGVLPASSLPELWPRNFSHRGQRLQANYIPWGPTPLETIHGKSYPLVFAGNILLGDLAYTYWLQKVRENGSVMDIDDGSDALVPAIGSPLWEEYAVAEDWKIRRGDQYRTSIGAWQMTRTSIPIEQLDGMLVWPPHGDLTSDLFRPSKTYLDSIPQYEADSLTVMNTNRRNRRYPGYYYAAESVSVIGAQGKVPVNWANMPKDRPAAFLKGADTKIAGLVSAVADYVVYLRQSESTLRPSRPISWMTSSELDPRATPFSTRPMDHRTARSATTLSMLSLDRQPNSINHEEEEETPETNDPREREWEQSARTQMDTASPGYEGRSQRDDGSEDPRDRNDVFQDLNLVRKLRRLIGHVPGLVENANEIIARLYAQNQALTENIEQVGMRIQETIAREEFKDPYYGQVRAWEEEIAFLENRIQDNKDLIDEVEGHAG